MSRQLARLTAGVLSATPILGLSAFLAALPGLAHADSCTNLSTTALTLDGTASTVSLTATDVAASGTVPAYCQVNAVLSSNANPKQSEIQVQVGLPLPGSWNGRLLGTGNGGFAGVIVTGEITYGVTQGFATVNSDLGTGLLFHCTTLYCGDKTGNGGAPGGLYHDYAAINDFGYGSMHLMTLAAKQLVATYYGQTQNKSYFMGCSTGGQNALMEGERYPTDYDGIVAGDAAYDRTHLHISSAAAYLATHFAADAQPPSSALTLLHNAVLSQCVGKDGGAPGDAYLMQPEMCTVTAASYQCTGAPTEVPCTTSTTSCTCIVPDQVQVLNTLYSGAKDSLGRTLYVGYERGTEDPATLSSGGLLAQGYLSEPLFDGIMYWAFGPDWTWQSLFANTTSINGELSKKVKAFDDTPVAYTDFEGALNATTPNWTSFYQRGSKLIIFHGYTDPLIPTASTYDYVNLIQQDAPNEYAKFLRLYLAPGVFHCSGGPGPDSFGFFGQTPLPLNASDDVLGALIAWREQGQAPASIIATKYASDNVTVTAQRPMCPYPQHAVYTAGADPTQASSFTCAAGSNITSKPFPPPYGP